MEAADKPIPTPRSWQTGNGRVGGEGNHFDEQAAAAQRAPGLSDKVASLAAEIARMGLFPDDVSALLDAMRDGLLKHNGHLAEHRALAEELACVADGITAAEGR